MGACIYRACDAGGARDARFCCSPRLAIHTDARVDTAVLRESALSLYELEHDVATRCETVMTQLINHVYTSYANACRRQGRKSNGQAAVHGYEYRYRYVSLVAPHEASTAMRHSNRLRLFDVGLPNFRLRSHEQKLSKKRCLMSWQPGISSWIDYRTLDCTSGRQLASMHWAQSCKQSVLPADQERAQRRYEVFPPEAQAWTHLRHCAGCHNKNNLNSVFLHTAHSCGTFPRENV